jgi:hypothetical protein
MLYLAIPDGLLFLRYVFQITDKMWRRSRYFGAFGVNARGASGNLSDSGLSVSGSKNRAARHCEVIESRLRKIVPGASRIVRKSPPTSRFAIAEHSCVMLCSPTRGGAAR